MDRIKTLSRRDFLKLSGFLAASAALSACVKETPIITPTPERTAIPTWTLPPSLATAVALNPTITPTDTSTIVPESPTPIPTETPVPPKIPEFIEPEIGNINLKNPFEIYLPEPTAKLASIWSGEKYFSIDVPKVVTEAELTDEEKKLMEPHNIPWDSNDPNSRVGLIFQTNNPNNLMLYAHTGYSFTGQELPLNFLRKIVRDHPDELIGLGFSLVQVDEIVNLEVVDYKVVTEEVFDASFANYKDDDNPLKRNVPLFLRFENVCDKDNACIDINSYPYNTGEKLITFVGCAGPIGDVASERMIVTARIVN